MAKKTPLKVDIYTDGSYLDVRGASACLIVANNGSRKVSGRRYDVRYDPENGSFLTESDAVLLALEHIDAMSEKPSSVTLYIDNQLVRKSLIHLIRTSRLDLPKTAFNSPKVREIWKALRSLINTRMRNVIWLNAAPIKSKDSGNHTAHHAACFLRQSEHIAKNVVFELDADDEGVKAFTQSQNIPIYDQDKEGCIYLCMYHNNQSDGAVSRTAAVALAVGNEGQADYIGVFEENADTKKLLSDLLVTASEKLCDKGIRRFRFYCNDSLNPYLIKHYGSKKPLLIPSEIGIGADKRMLGELKKSSRNLGINRQRGFCCKISLKKDFWEKG